MPYYEFEKNDVFANTIELNPDCNFFIYKSKAYYKNKDQLLSNSNTPSGHINLYELNVNRPAASLIYPFLPKGSSLERFRTVSTSQYAALAAGALMQGTYPLTASITTAVYDTSATRKQVDALKNTLNFYKYRSQHYAFSSSLGNKGTQRLSMLDFPSIFYGSNIKPGTVDLRFYLSGSLLGKLTDKNRNGELIQSSGTISANDSKVAGVVLYNEGIIILTGSWDLNTTHTSKYVTDGGAAQRPRWNAFARKTEETVSSSYEINVKGTQKLNMMTMFAHAIPGDLNFSPNPTYATFDNAVKNEITYVTSSTSYTEPGGIKLVNTVSSSYLNYDEKFQKQTFISKIGIYDSNRNLIAIAKLATPVRKRENDQYTFKLKLDY